MLDQQTNGELQMTALSATPSPSEGNSHRLPTPGPAHEVHEKLAARAIEDLIAAVKASQLEEINKKLDEHTRILSDLTHGKRQQNGNVLNKVGLAALFVATGLAAGAFLTKTWPVMVAWMTQVFSLSA
jgi:hypothetical protein